MSVHVRTCRLLFASLVLTHSTAGLTGFAIFVSVTGIFYSLFLLLVPVVYEKYDKGARLARALKEVRVGFILSGTGTAVSLLISCVPRVPFDIHAVLTYDQLHCDHLCMDRAGLQEPG